MGYKRKVKFHEKEVWGEEVEFEIEKENWNSYVLDDGTRLRTKSVVAKVFRLELFKEDGEPIYLVNSSNLISADVPEGLKKKE